MKLITRELCFGNDLRVHGNLFVKVIEILLVVIFGDLFN